MPLQLNPSKHCFSLFVDMKFDGLENNIVEISSHSDLDWYFHITVEERGMKYLFVVFVDDVSMRELALTFLNDRNKCF